MAKTLRVGIRMGPAGRALERSIAAKTGEVDLAQTIAKSDASLLIRAAIEAARVSNAELARRLDCDRARVSRLLDGGQNLTIGTLVEALHALGYKLELAAEPVRGAVPAARRRRAKKG